MLAHAERRIAPSGGIVSVSDPFRGYKKERSQAVREADTKEGTMAKVHNAWLEWMSQVTSRKPPIQNEIDEDYNLAISLLEGISISNRDLEGFIISLIPYQDDAKFRLSGLFISALINTGKDDECIISLKNIDCTPQSLGYKNTKNLTITDVKDWIGNVGHGMESGVIIVNGNVAGIGDKMKGGTIISNGQVFASVGSYMEGGMIIANVEVGIARHLESCNVGHEMKGGRILVKGGMTGNVGDNMLGGRIEVEGDIGWASGINTSGSVGSRMNGGKVSVNGNVFGRVGWSMENGFIAIFGSVYDSMHNIALFTEFPMIGTLMVGGQINVEGENAKVDYKYFKAGRVYHKGKLIAGKEEGEIS